MKTLISLGLAVSVLTGVSVAMAQHGGNLLRLDSDGDGRVSRDEFRPPAEHRGSKRFERADADGDGAVSRDEMIAMDDGAQERGEQHRERRLQRFDETDSDGNGVVDRNEAQDQAFGRMDADGDGFVTDEEARAMHEARKSRHQRPAEDV